MPRPSPAPEAARLARLRWSGPALIALGVLMLAALLVSGPRAGNSLPAWIVQEALAPVRVLPLIGIGAAFGMADARARIAAALAAAVGVAMGFAFYADLLEPLWIVPRAAENRFLTGPLLALAAGAALMVPHRRRPMLLPPCAFIAGVALALGIVVSDPSIHDGRYVRAGVLTALWIAASTALCARACRGRVLDIAGRIFGSWLVAIALLYGAAALVPPRAILPDAPAGAERHDNGVPDADEPPPQ